MDEIIGLLLSNFTTLCLSIGLFIIVLTNKTLEEKTNRCFAVYAILIFVSLAADITDYYLTGFTEPSFLRYITSSLNYTLRPAMVALFVGVLLRRKKSGIILWIPVILVSILSFTSYFTHLMFWFNNMNNFMRGPLGYASHIISGAYLLALIILTITMHRYITSGEIFVVMYISVICVFAATLESVMSKYKFLLTGAMMVSCALYYIVLYIETYKRDPLTGLMNRKCFYLDSQRIRGKSAALISIDLNGLKSINDSRGHSAGDKALQTLGSAMLVKSGKKFRVYRVGGDEFAAVGKGQTADAAAAYIDDMRSFLTENGIMAAFGCAMLSPGDSFDDICNYADSLMYEDKKKYKHRTEERS